ncbi:Wall-associated receptor kinase 2 [Hordeum vulgare]|nr:Wall-associated receptor kinase 2 [Hordeum vulgare]
MRRGMALVLVLVLLLFSAMPRGAVSRELGLPPEATIKRNMTCNSIPYPFGVRGRSIPGFEVTCGPNKEAMLPIGKHSYLIHDVSVQGGFVVLILAGDISQVCYDRNGTRMRTTGIGDISLEQTPFSIIGAGGYHRMILDWAVGRGTCDQASQHNLDRRYCNHMSGCIDAPNGAGHLCKCNAGYDGNPYAADGCLDIDECRALGSNNCTFPILCHNTDGGFTCPCPHNWTGDGYKTGTGCNPSVISSDISKKYIYLFRYGGSRFECVRSSSKEPCTYLEYCSEDGQGVPACDCPQDMRGDGRRRGSGCRVLVLAVGGGISLICLVPGIIFFMRTLKARQAKRLRAKYFKENRGLLLKQLVDKDIAERMIFNLEELEKATNKFDEARKLGGGGHGTVYKGILSNQDVVAIKKSKITIQREIEDFVNEVAILSQINHRNVVRLFGCCLETQVPLLVYEFISNGTLSDYLHVEGTLSLPWGDRLRIALETAGALAYLHSSALTSIIHRDIKSANILLDHRLIAKVSDFGASRGIPIDQTGVTTAIQGTFGYLDPEYYQTSRLTDKSDVYSFGVILVELLTRKKPSAGMHLEDGSLIAQFILVIRQDKLCEILDPQVISECLEGAKDVASLALTCLSLKGEDRPTMRQVEMALERLLVANKNTGQGRSTELNYTPTQISNNNDENSRQYSAEQALLLSATFPR